MDSRVKTNPMDRDGLSNSRKNIVFERDFVISLGSHCKGRSYSTVKLATRLAIRVFYW